MSLSRGLSKVKNFLNLIEVPAILLLVWGAVSHFGLFPEFLLPSPEKVWSSFVELLVCGELWKHIAASAGRVFGGFFLAMLVAIPLAYFFYYSPIPMAVGSRPRTVVRVVIRIGRRRVRPERISASRADIPCSRRRTLA